MTHHRTAKKLVAYRASRRAFTIVELVFIVSAVALLATLAVVSYNGTQRRAVDVSVRDAVVSAHDNLQIYSSDRHAYPSNMAETDFVSPDTVATVLFTDAAQTPVYSGLNAAQNAQLFLNACNGYMPVVDGATTYNTSCVFSGNNLHVKGTQSSNIVLGNPVASEDFVLTCGSACTAAQNAIITTFQSQGGVFPVITTSAGVALPAPVLVSSGKASRYCVQGRSSRFADIVYHAVTGGQGIVAGECPEDAGLHYP